MAFKLFGKKDKTEESDVPSPPSEDLPTFPSPEELEESSKMEIEASQSSEEDIKGAAEARAETDLQRFKSRTVREERKSLHKREVEGPLFVKMHTYRDILGELSQIGSSIDGAKQNLKDVADINDEESDSYENWKDTVKDVHEKLIFVDETLFKRG